MNSLSSVNALSRALHCIWGSNHFGRFRLISIYPIIVQEPIALTTYKMAAIRRSSRNSLKSTSNGDNVVGTSKSPGVEPRKSNTASKKSEKSAKTAVKAAAAGAISKANTKRKVENGSSESTVTPKKKSKKEISSASAAEAVVPVSEPETPKRVKTPKRVRRADPHATNAPLQTPGGTKVLKTYPTTLLETPSQIANGLPKDAITTENLLERACAHLCSVDPKLHHVISKHHCKLFSPEGLAEVIDPFVALSSSIMAQQVSGAAASSIKRKFIGLFHPAENGEVKSDHVMDGQKFPTPTQVAATDIPTLRTAGLSERKAEYIQGLAAKFASGELSAQMLVEANDEELFEKLIAVRGLGRWSVEMFACFALKRMDIFSTGDLGVQRGMAAYVGKDVAKLKAKGGGKWKYMSEQDMLNISNQFAPYRSLFMWYMWRIEDVDIAVLEK